MKWLQRRLQNEGENNSTLHDANKDKEFKSFPETYRLITFALSTGMIYPNPKTERYRMLAIPLFISTTIPLLYMIFVDAYYSWLSRDIVNMIRHSTVAGPFLGGFFKMILMFHKRVQAKEIIDEISRDYESYNLFTGPYREAARDGVRNSLIYSERCWVITVLTCVLTFPFMAVLQNIHSTLFTTEQAIYMIHDVNMPFSPPEDRFKSPFYELIFVYQMMCSVFYIINFIGYDGLYGLVCNHACMKMHFFCEDMEAAMKSKDIEKKVAEVVNDQNKLYLFASNIQDTFNIWLGIIFLATMIQICCCLYQITEGFGFDLRYMIFVIGAVIHIYLPCRYAAKLKSFSAETALKIYCGGWEEVNDPRVWKMLMFAVARAQNPIEITGFGMITFDMELFVRIMQTSHSMYTLLRS